MKFFTPEGHLPSVGDKYEATCGCVWEWVHRSGVEGWRRVVHCDMDDGDD